MMAVSPAGLLAPGAGPAQRADALAAALRTLKAAQPELFGVYFRKVSVAWRGGLCRPGSLF
jgi:hypothetical protein